MSQSLSNPMSLVVFILFFCLAFWFIRAITRKPKPGRGGSKHKKIKSCGCK